ncbi:hypothetical protein HHK36_019151 [Tetracentron sinense]|uniref:Transcription factor CBF/NF-Y/archaeal histone domain-containing protein n=1 Tax=Tetracentron sinense TaxID=13715 RepID=A0A835D8W9_TETSI|nr:hypothetical protein HHK36_019151 [Tetracentron sinense]
MTLLFVIHPLEVWNRLGYLLEGERAKAKTREEMRRSGLSSNGIKKEAEIVVVPSSSASQELNEYKEEEEAAKSSNISNQNSDKGKEEEEEEELKKRKNVVGSYCFPMQRIKRIIRSEGDDFRITQESAFLINKAAGQFLELFGEDAYACSVEDGKKAVDYNHLSSVVCKGKRYDFLTDFVPEKIRAEDALAERRLAGT